MTSMLLAGVGWAIWAWLPPALRKRVVTGLRRSRGRPALRACEASDLIDLLALSARRGASLGESLGRCVRFSPPERSELLRPVERALALGTSATDAVRLAAIDPATPLGLALDALADAAASGRPLAAELDRIGADLRRLDSQELTARARRLSVWLSGPLVMCHLPAFALIAVVPSLLAVFGP